MGRDRLTLGKPIVGASAHGEKYHGWCLTGGFIRITIRAMELKTYIRTHSVEACAARWGYKPRRVQSWLYGQRTPGQKAANRIVHLTGGEVTLAGIYAQAGAA